VGTILYDPEVRDFADDDVLVKALIARDADAFAFLMQSYHAALLRLAAQYVPSRAVAEEVVQETWVAVIEGIDRFEQRSTVKTWLFRILVNVARTRGVKEHRSIPFASADVIDDDEPAVDPRRFRRFGRHAAGAWKRPPNVWPDPEQQALDAEAVAVAERAIEELPPAQREVLVMRDVLGWAASDVCDALSLSDGNQRILLHRGRSRIRRALERYYDEGGHR
jgi:RNA polymerase sigma-70 factor (ECF subfamily)